MQRYNHIKILVDIHSKPWCVVGTGKSITNLINIQIYNIWAINHAIFYTKYADVLSLFDGPVFHEIDYKKYEYKALLTRTRSLSYVDLDDPKLCFVEFDIDHVKMNKVRFFSEPVSAVQNSSSMAVCILGQMGVKRIYLAGMGGSGKHEMFNEYHTCKLSNDLNLEYSKHMSGCLHWANHFGIELINL